MKAAGILFYSPQMRSVFLVRRSKDVTSPGIWTSPGGKIEASDRNAWCAAVREVLEEIRYFPSEFGPAFSSTCDGYKVFVVGVPWSELKHFSNRVQLNFENDDAKWFSVDTLGDVPEMIHQCLEKPVSVLRGGE